MNVSRKRGAQVCAAAAVVAVLLPWHSATDGISSTPGTGVDEGRIVFIICLITIVLIHVGWRPAWIGAGFAGAITVREILDLSGSGEPDPAYGLWITGAACLAAVILLIWDMFASIAADGGTDGGEGTPDGRGLSGPLGKRRR